MLATLSGKVESSIILISKYVMLYICFKIMVFQYLFSRFTSLLDNISYISECLVKHLIGKICYIMEHLVKGLLS